MKQAVYTAKEQQHYAGGACGDTACAVRGRSSKMDSLALNNVTKQYKGFRLEDVASGCPSSIMGLIGENRAGKTTDQADFEYDPCGCRKHQRVCL